MFRLSLYPVGGDHYLAVVAVAVVLLALLWLGPGRARLDRSRRRTLMAIRLAVILLVVAAMLRPTLVYTKTTKREATLILLADRTRSMTVPDEVNGRTRFEALNQALSDADDSLRELQSAPEFQIKAYAFDADPHATEMVDGRFDFGPPRGDQSAIGFALESVLRQEAGRRLLGVILLSDGAQRALPATDALHRRDLLPQTAAAQMKLQGDRLFTVRFGKSRGLGQSRDVALTDLLAADRVFVKNELTVTAQVLIDGYANREIPVKLLFETPSGEMETVASENVEAPAGRLPVPVTFSYVPRIPGEYKLSVEVAEQPGELVTTNNRAGTFVNVLKGGLNVLYLVGTLSEEVAFLRRSLDVSDDVNVDFRWIDPERPETRRWDLAEDLQPGKYEVYLLADIDSAAFKPGELQSVAENVAAGAGLIMTGGFHSFGPGGYAETPLADLLPIKTSRLERQRFEDPVRKELHFWNPLKMTPTAIGLAHFTLGLAGTREESLEVWNRLPPLLGANKLNKEAVKPSALILAQGERGEPLLIAQPYANGRVMAFAGDSTWQWWMQGYENAHKRFWRQIVLWLARKDESLEGNVWVQLAQRRFSPGGKVEFSVGIQSPTGEYPADADGTAEIRLPDGSTQPLSLTRTGGELTGSFRDTLSPGDYTIRVTVNHRGQILGSAKARFLVADQDLELDNAAADPSLLDSLAAATGGHSLAPEELPGLIQELIAQTDQLEEKTETKQSLWDSWPFFLIFVGLLGTEWYLRKRWGLV
jgi:uncharacterized membrane protein